MIEVLAKQSVEIKIRFKSATLLGNYEFYYAAGIVCRELGLSPEEEIRPKELQEFIVESIKGKEPLNDIVKHLEKMIRFYKPDETFDGQMSELLLDGMKK